MFRPRRKPRKPPTDMRSWEMDPPGFAATLGAPRTDVRIWWRLEPGAPPILHGGTCIEWPPGRHPDGWRFLTRPEARRSLADGAAACEWCKPNWFL